MLKVGDKAPDFSAAASNGEEIRLSALRGRKVVMYFFPKAFTPGCTAQARRFRDNYDEIKALGAEVIGVSVDEPSVQCDFATAERVRYPLIGDDQRLLGKLYDVVRPVLRVEKRVTYVIDEAGVVEAVFDHEFQVSRHLDDVMAHLRQRRLQPLAAQPR
ncbi:MAG: peroxiredoxin [Myxococcota bacterium]